MRAKLNEKKSTIVYSTDEDVRNQAALEVEAAALWCGTADASTVGGECGGTAGARDRGPLLGAGGVTSASPSTAVVSLAVSEVVKVKILYTHAHTTVRLLPPGLVFSACGNTLGG